VLSGRKHFISNGDVADVAIAFAVTGEDQTDRGPRKRISAFLVDRGTPGFEVARGAPSVGHRGYHHCELAFTDCRVADEQMLGGEAEGIESRTAGCTTAA